MFLLIILTFLVGILLGALAGACCASGTCGRSWPGILARSCTACRAS